MAKMDSDVERVRLEKVYSGMDDAELDRIACDAKGLTAVALETLRTEMLRRGLTAPPAETGPSGDAADRTDSPEPRLITLQRYRDMPPAFVAKSILDSAGIESFLSDENALGMNWLISNAVGGIKLLAREEDAEAAKALLEEGAPEKFDVEGVGEYEQPKCPKCGSRDVSFEELEGKTAYGIFLKVPISSLATGWTCHSCGNIWEHGHNS
jgi:hypothetical protein